MAKQSLLNKLLSHRNSSSPLKIMERAHKKAEGIVSKAVVKAESLIDETNIFDKKIVEEYQDILKEQLEKINNLYLMKYKETLDRLEKTAEEKLTESLNSQIEIIKQETAAYKKTKMAIIDHQIKEKVNQIAQKIFHQSLNNNQVAELIIKALEQAEKQGIFNG